MSKDDNQQPALATTEAGCPIPDCDRPSRSSRIALCDPHYRRKKKFGDPLKGGEIRQTIYSYNGALCAAEGCESEAKANNYCSPHWSRVKAHGSPLAHIPIKKIMRAGETEECSIEECSRPRKTRGLCGAHYGRWFKSGDDFDRSPIRSRTAFSEKCSVDGCSKPGSDGGMCRPHADHRRRGKSFTEGCTGYKKIEPWTGYVIVYTSSGWGKLYEHRLVWESHHGPLLPGQNIHHKNGVRDDNRIENLEAWDTTQPAGQRPEDKVAHAVEIIKRYPELAREAGVRVE